MTRIVLLGAPGSGKGTQAQRLEATFAIPQVSSGDLLRDAVARGTELGRKAKSAMDAGRLVSDDIVLGLIRERLAQPDAERGFILDGYPRNADQAAALEQLLAEIGQPLDAVVLLDVGRELLHRRLAGRRTCRTCGRVFNVFFSPPGTPPRCGRCNDEPDLFQRPDDREEVIDKRLEVYEEQTRPLIEHYARQGLLQIVKGEGPLEEVFGRMQSVFFGVGATVPLAQTTRIRRKTSVHGKRANRKPAARTVPSQRSAAKREAPGQRKTARRSKSSVKRAAVAKGKATAKRGLSRARTQQQSAVKKAAVGAKKATRKPAKSK